ncbi:MAG: FHA domain-containing protein [Burkholderiales bacterium]|nr:FHA domain-containing protein [Burkholderiales bacterium]
MAKLVLSTEGSIVDQRFLDDARLTVGRGADNAIVVDDAAVDDLQFAIVVVGNDHILEHLAQGAGTVVNGKPVRRRILQHGDVVELGVYHLRYVDAKTSSAFDLERTMLIAGLPPPMAAVAGDAAERTDSDAPPARVSTVHFPRGRVRWSDDTGGERTQELDRVVATFGVPGVQLAVVTRRPHGYFLTHVEGRVSARVNGRSIGTQPLGLRHGDVIEVGDDKLHFEIF